MFALIKVILNPVKNPPIKAVSVPSKDFSCITAAASAKLYLFSSSNTDATDHLKSSSQSGKFKLSFMD